jgi:O-antigen/teichoic acid export membrane protein
VLALFAGSLAGQIAALTVGISLIGARTIFARPSRSWLWRIVCAAPTATIGLLLDAVWGVAENALLSATRGLGAVGIWTHARLYNNLLAGAVASVNHNAWSASLAEARDVRSDFAATRRVWGPVHVAVTAIGLAFAFVGAEVVDLLTNGKLTAAATYVPCFAVIALLHNAARGATAVVYAGGRGPAATRIHAGATLAGLVLLYPVMARYGLAGIAALLLAIECIDAVAARVLSRRDRRAHWHLSALVAGIGVIAAAAAIVQIYEPAFATRVALLALSLAASGFAGRKSLRDVRDTVLTIMTSRTISPSGTSARAR